MLEEVGFMNMWIYMLNLDYKATITFFVLDGRGPSSSIIYFNIRSPRIISSSIATVLRMSMFRAKKLDLGCFINIKTIRDHTKRKVFAEHETERYILPSSNWRLLGMPSWASQLFIDVPNYTSQSNFTSLIYQRDGWHTIHIDKLFATSSAT